MKILNWVSCYSGILEGILNISHNPEWCFFRMPSALYNLYLLYLREYDALIELNKMPGAPDEIYQFLEEERKKLCDDMNRSFDKLWGVVIEEVKSTTQIEVIA